MARRTEQENSAPSSNSRSQALSNRVRKPTEQAQRTRDAKAAQEEAFKEKKLQTARRRVLRQCQQETALTVEQQDDTAEVKELRAALARARGERNAAEAATQRPAHRPEPASRSITRPRNMSKVTIAEMRAHLGLAASKNDQVWYDLRSDVRRFMDAGMLDSKVGWKEQDSRKLAKVYDAIEEAYPKFQRFRGQWGTAYLVQEIFKGKKTYKNCKATDGTYRWKTREARMSQLERRCQTIYDSADDEYLPRFVQHKGTGPRAPSRNPASSPTSPPSQGNGAAGHVSSHAESLSELTEEEQ